MIFQTSKPIALTVCGVLMLLTGCTQAPNYAPVKTVNQALEPDNGYVQEKPAIKPNPHPDGAQQLGKISNKKPVAIQIQPQAVTNNSNYFPSNQNNTHQNPTGGVAVKKEASATSRPGNSNADQDQQIKKSAKLSNKPEKPIKIKAENTAAVSQSASKSQKMLVIGQEPNNKLKDKAIISNANTKITHKNPQDNVKKLDNLQLTGKNNKEEKSIISIDNKKVLKLNFQWPLQGSVSRNFSQTDNKGIDITGKTGQAVRAAEAGRAVYCGQGLAGLGNLAIIKHNETYLTAYANNSKLTIKEGQRVEKGQTIGQVGLAGLKKASLHFEIRKNGKPINPLTILPKH